MEERLLSKSVLLTDSDCWLWIGKRSAGYGRLNVRRDGRHVTLLAHRVSYETWVGPIPEGMEVDHVCRERLCINPAHLRLATPKENSTNRVYKNR